MRFSDAPRAVSHMRRSLSSMSRAAALPGCASRRYLASSMMCAQQRWRRHPSHTITPLNSGSTSYSTSRLPERHVRKQDRGRRWAPRIQAFRLDVQRVRRCAPRKLDGARRRCDPRGASIYCIYRRALWPVLPKDERAGSRKHLTNASETECRLPDGTRVPDGAYISVASRMLDATPDRRRALLESL